MRCGSPLGSPRLLWGAGGGRRGRAGGGGAGGRVRGAARAGGLPPPEPLRSAEPGARRRRLAESSAGTAASQSREPPGPSPHLPAGLWGRFPTCRALCVLWDLEVAFLEAMRGLPPGRSARGLSGWPGGDPARRGELAQISGLFGERHVARLLWLCCTVTEKGIPIESWQTLLE